MENLQFDIEKIKNISLEEKKSREESLKIFNKEGFPNKRLEEWKFTDLNKIINDNFNDLSSFHQVKNQNTIYELKDFEHNSIILINGIFQSSNFNFENKKKRAKTHEEDAIAQEGNEEAQRRRSQFYPNSQSVFPLTLSLLWFW